MFNTQMILKHLIGNTIVDALVETLSKNFDDFAAAKERCDKAMACLREEIGDSVQDEMAAIEQQTASNLFFSGLLGLKANWDHFVDPVARTFLDVDPENYLREMVSHDLPKYRQAQETRNRFRDQLTSHQENIYEDITGYVTYLETAAPKLAHYCGYLLGNELLYHAVPGYHPDLVLTNQYRMTMRDYFGKQVIPQYTPDLSFI